MKLETTTDIENIAKAIEDDAGHPIDSIREALAEVRDGDIGRVSSREQLTVRAARKNAGVSQSVFAKQINTPLRTLQEWEQGRSIPPGAAVKLCEIILDNPSLVLSAS